MTDNITVTFSRRTLSDSDYSFHISYSPGVHEPAKCHLCGNQINLPCYFWVKGERVVPVCRKDAGQLLRSGELLIGVHKRREKVEVGMHG